jgi:hypothetical protein
LARLDAQARKEESIQAQLQHYRDLAEQIARQRFGLPPAPGLSETLAPTHRHFMGVAKRRAPAEDPRIKALEVDDGSKRGSDADED